MKAHINKHGLRLKGLARGILELQGWLFGPWSSLN